jgi:hypothetical protein
MYVFECELEIQDDCQNSFSILSYGKNLVQIIYSEISEQYESKLGWSGM